MALPITSGKKHAAQICTIYGPEGSGKTDLASLAPNPVFLDLEDGTIRKNVNRLPKPTSRPMLFSLLNEFTKDSMGFRSLVVDTIDWVEPILVQDILAGNQLKALGGNNDYGYSYGLLETAFCQFLDCLTEIRNRGIHVIILAHSKVRKQELPEEFGAFDHYELKLEKKPSAKLKEWTESLLFLNYRTLVIEDSKTKTKHAQGGERVLYTEHHPCWDAKNRENLPPEIVYTKGIFPAELRPMFMPAPVPASTPAPVSAPAPAQPQQQPRPGVTIPANMTPELRQLFDLMQQDGIQPNEVQEAIAAKGFFPPRTPFENLPVDFVKGMLIANWPKIKDSILKGRSNVAA